MEGVIRRARYARYGTTAKRRRKVNIMQELTVKIIKQAIVCILILFVLTIIKLLNFSATNNFLAGCNNILESETNIQSVYASIDKMVNFFRDSKITDMLSDNSLPVSTVNSGEGTAGREASGGLVSQASGSGAPAIGTATGTGQEAAVNKTEISQGASSAGGNSTTSKTSASSNSSTSSSTSASGTAATQAATSALKQKYSFLFPVDGIITSGYGNRIHPIKKTEEFHNGIDIEAPKGTPVKASLDGEIIEVSEDPSFGKFLRLKTDNEIVTLYAHCSQILASKGQKVKKGTIIARVGDTGASLGTHLHFEVWVNGKTTDPAVFFER